MGLYFLPTEEATIYDSIEPLNTQWYHVSQDGTKNPIDIPTDLELPDGATCTFTANLPNNIEDNSTLCFRASKQDMQIYIDGNLRETYSNEKTRIYTNTSPGAYIYIPLNTNDSQKEITVISQSGIGNSGVLKEVYYGDKLDIFLNLSLESTITTVSALVALSFALLAIIACLVLRIYSKYKTSFIYLALGVVLICAWLITRSSLRQVIFNNITLARNMSYWTLILLPIPILMYMNDIQKFRYQKLYSISTAFSIVVFIFVNISWFSTPSDLSAYIPLIWASLILAILFLLFSILRDWRKKLLKEYRLVAIGFTGIAFAGIYQMFIYLENTSTYSGLVMSVGVIFLLIMAAIKALLDHSKSIDEKNTLQKSIEEKSVKIEKLSEQVLNTLAQTIDAKDSYTNGHSFRVAYYSLLLAKELKIDKRTQTTIYYSALLHDIGKIGVPDDVLGKEEKLTDEEYAIIKTHTTIGFDILKQMSEIPQIEYGAKWHHERYDGKGYPDALKGKHIPLNARIIAVADAYDAMTSSRVYRKELPPEYVKNEIIKGIGTQFDPKIGQAMLDLIENHPDVPHI